MALLKSFVQILSVVKQPVGRVALLLFANMHFLRRYPKSQIDSTKIDTSIAK